VWHLTKHGFHLAEHKPHGCIWSIHHWLYRTQTVINFEPILYVVASDSSSPLSFLPSVCTGSVTFWILPSINFLKAQSLSLWFLTVVLII